MTLPEPEFEAILPRVRAELLDDGSIYLWDDARLVEPERLKRGCGAAWTNVVIEHFSQATSVPVPLIRATIAAARRDGRA